MLQNFDRPRGQITGIALAFHAAIHTIVHRYNAGRDEIDSLRRLRLVKLLCNGLHNVQLPRVGTMGPAAIYTRQCVQLQKG